MKWGRDQGRGHLHIRTPWQMTYNVESSTLERGCSLSGEGVGCAMYSVAIPDLFDAFWQRR